MVVSRLLIESSWMEEALDEDRGLGNGVRTKRRTMNSIRQESRPLTEREGVVELVKVYPVGRDWVCWNVLPKYAQSSASRAL